ncbi:hypothetical protein LTR56_019957 [Elasticomyces elasticus]|nr:hypothetical protein LTR56_019957 [Elasticomyces elasticus]KAK3634066.1 hypothetical protein LTR22_019798 [Elasticomyces elasticus]KAK4911151.1 hypothetical protein LTR49_020223 [Elasticomyces elasticus]KAK5738504.1 hypothetical protein LTS12_025581 [Elasticomyces elasticus]
MAAKKAASATAPASPQPRRSSRLAAETTNNRIAKPKPAAKAKPVKFTCTTCDRTLAGSSFPKYLATDNCKHLINTCKQCSQAWVAAQMESTIYDKVSCPECPEVLNNEGVKILASKEVYAKFDEIERRTIAETVPGWRWCMNTKCRAGQVHEPLLQAGEVGKVAKEGSEEIEEADRKEWATAKRALKPRAAKKTPAKKGKAVIDLTQDSDPAEDIFTCKDCGAKACVPCDRPFHEGETCSEYQERRKFQTETQDKASEKFIKKQCKQCPNAECKKSIEKNGGCDAVYCTQCRTQFCWICTAPYTIISVSGHYKGCTYAKAGAIDPHAMPNPAQAHGGGVLFQNGAQVANGGFLQNIVAAMGWQG